MPPVKKEVGWEGSGKGGRVDGCVFSVEVGGLWDKGFVDLDGSDLMKTAILWYVCLQVFFFLRN